MQGSSASRRRIAALSQGEEPVIAFAHCYDFLRCLQPCQICASYQPFVRGGAGVSVISQYCVQGAVAADAGRGRRHVLRRRSPGNGKDKFTRRELCHRRCSQASPVEVQNDCRCHDRPRPPSVNTPWLLEPQNCPDEAAWD